MGLGLVKQTGISRRQWHWGKKVQTSFYQFSYEPDDSCMDLIYNKLLIN